MTIDNASHPSHDPPGHDTRRKFCQAAIGGMTLVSAGTVGYPVVTFLKLPTSMTQEEAVEMPLAELANGGAFWAERRGQQIVIVRIDDTARAFNGACPHLGCLVQWEGTTRTFKCPCHGAAFNDRGEPMSGPVNSPLEAVKFEIANDVLTLT